MEIAEHEEQSGSNDADMHQRLNIRISCMQVTIGYLKFKRVKYDKMKQVQV